MKDLEIQSISDEMEWKIIGIIFYMELWEKLNET